MEIRKKKVVAALLTTITCLNLSVSVVHAYDPKLPYGSQDFDIVDVASWDQMGYYGVAPRSPKMQGFDWSLGCMTMSYATFMRKSGQRGKDWGPAHAYEELQSYGDYAGSSQFCMPRYNTGAKWGSWVVDSYQSGGFAQMKQAWEEGYAIIVHVTMGSAGTHVFTLDYIEGNDVYILDTGRSGLRLDDSGQWGKGSIIGFYKLKSSDGTKGKDLAKLTQVRDGSNAVGSSSESGDGEGDEGSVGDGVSAKILAAGGGSLGPLAKEHELVGMIERNARLSDYQLPIILPGQANVSGGGNVGLSQTHQVNLQSISSDVKNNEFNFISTVRIAISFLGILSVVSSILLFVAWLFDRANVFIEGSLLGLLSFGRYGYSQENSSYKSGKTKYLNLSGIIKICLFAQIVGWFLISGYAYMSIYRIISFISEHFQ